LHILPQLGHGVGNEPSAQVSAAWNIFGSLPGIAALVVGGSLSDLMEARDAAGAAHCCFSSGR